MNRLKRGWGAPAGVPRRRINLGKKINPGEAAHFTNDSEYPATRKPPPEPKDDKRYTKLSSACEKGRHGICFAKKCECECGHVSI